MTFAELQKLAPAFDWNGYYAATGLRQGDLNVNEPKLMQEFGRQLRETSLADWQTYLRSRVLDSAAPVAVQRLRQGGVRVPRVSSSTARAR